MDMHGQDYTVRNNTMFSCPSSHPQDSGALWQETRNLPPPYWPIIFFVTFLITCKVLAAQKAAVKAVQDALEKTSLPAVLEFVPGGFEGVRIKAKIAVPYPVSSWPVMTMSQVPCLGRAQESPVLHASG